MHPRLWRSLLSYTGDVELASDAEAEAFAQVLRLGDAVDDVAAWVWRGAFRIASGLLAARSRPDDVRLADGSAPPTDSVAEFLGLLAELSPATAGLCRAALRRRVHVTRNRRAARDERRHCAGAAASGPRHAAPHDQGGRACLTTLTQR